MKRFIAVFELNSNNLDHSVLERVERSFEHFEGKKGSHFTNNFAVSLIDITGNDPAFLETDNHFVFGDIRLDNRSELESKITGNNLKIQADEELIIALYRTYGTKMLNSLIGEFAFVIFNKQQKEIICVRDQIGIKTLFWTNDQSRTWISSDLSLLAPKISNNYLNQDYFFEFYHSQGVIDSIVTPFNGINRLSGGSFINFKNGDENPRKYWEISNENKEIRYKSQVEYEEHFFHLFKKAVECRLLSNGNAISMSGGLDSTAIYAMAKLIESDHPSQKIIPVCGIFDKYKSCDERYYIRLVLEMYKDNAFYENCDSCGLLKDFPNDSPWIYEPAVNSLTYGFTKTLMSRAKRIGAMNLLTGYAGDHILSGSPVVLADLTREFKIKHALSQAINYTYGTRLSFPSVFWSYGLKPNFQKREKGRIDYSSLTFNQIEFCVQLMGTKSRIFLDQVIGHELGIEIKHPFLDRRIIEFMFNVPGTLRWSRGTTKYLLRQSLRNLLPQEILTRMNKTQHTEIFYKGIRESWNKLFPVLAEGRVVELGLIKRDDWLEMLKKWGQGYLTRDDFWILLSIELWLYKFNCS